MSRKKVYRSMRDRERDERGITLSEAILKELNLKEGDIINGQQENRIMEILNTQTRALRQNKAT